MKVSINNFNGYYYNAQSFSGKSKSNFKNVIIIIIVQLLSDEQSH